MSKEQSTPERRAKYKAALRKALKAGHAVLEGGGEAMDAAVAAVSVMEGKFPCGHRSPGLADLRTEDCPLFNSARGAVFNVAGKVRVHETYLQIYLIRTHRMSLRHLSCYLNLLTLIRTYLVRGVDLV